MTLLDFYGLSDGHHPFSSHPSHTFYPSHAIYRPHSAYRPHAASHAKRSTQRARIAQKRQRMLQQQKDDAFAILEDAEASLQNALNDGNVAAVQSAANAVSKSAKSLEGFGRSNSVLQATEGAEEMLSRVPKEDEIVGCAQVKRALRNAEPQLKRIEAFVRKAQSVEEALRELRGEYVLANEMLTRSMTELDGVEVSGPSSEEGSARAKRKEGVKLIDAKLLEMENAARRLEEVLKGGGAGLFQQGRAY